MDHSPEQYSFGEHDNDIHLYENLRPIPSFQDQEDTSLSESSHEEVFLPKSPKLPNKSKLRRRNAMRLKKNQSEPRMTRNRLSQRNISGTRSQPSTPTADNLLRCQNLSNRLNSRRPLVPDAVNLHRAQNLEHALDDAQRTERRWTLRDRPRLNYLQLHLGAEQTSRGTKKKKESR